MRLSKLRCVDKIAPRSGYRRWREMQLRMNRAMQRILQGRAKMSVLLPGRSPGKEKAKGKRTKNRKRKGKRKRKRKRKKRERERDRGRETERKRERE